MMKPTWFFLLISLWHAHGITSSCRQANWWSSFDKKGWSTCGYDTYYMNGLFRNDNGGRNDKIFRLEEARCCPRPPVYWNNPVGCVVGDWSTDLDRNNHWAMCPAGYFLQGLYRGGDIHNSYLHNIEYGKCCKPANHPRRYEKCYTHSVASSFDKKGTSKCNDGYFMTGLYRGNCDLLYCIETFRCCKMVDPPPLLKSLSDVKTRVMDTTVPNLALLAYYLGYQWCSGCRAQNVGEDFVRIGDSWRADTRGQCNGYKAYDRLKIHYGDFSFGIKDIKYGAPVKQELNPEEVSTGWMRNDYSFSSQKILIRSVKTSRTVTHTTTSPWSNSEELGISLIYTPQNSTGGVGGSVDYKFGYKSNTTTTDSEGKQQTQEFRIITHKMLPGNTKANWRIMVNKTRTTVPYIATIIFKFSAELDGFLRWGGGYNGKNPNFHHQHRGTNTRPFVRYKFGSAETPFYEDLKKQYTDKQLPWEWENMINKYGGADWTIRKLYYERHYKFTLTGKFEDVVGNAASIYIGEVVPNTVKREAGADGDAKPADEKSVHEFANQEGDPAPVNPALPAVKINVPRESDLRHISPEEEILSDVKEEFSKRYTFPTGRNSEVDGNPLEEDDGNDELIPDDDVKNVVSVDESSDVNVVKLVGKDLEEIEKVVDDPTVEIPSEQLNDQFESNAEMNDQFESNAEMNDQLDENEGMNDQLDENAGMNDQLDENAGMSEQFDEKAGMNEQFDENARMSDQFDENAGMNDQFDESAGMDDQLDEQTKRNVKGYIRKLLSEAINKKR